MMSKFKPGKGFMAMVEQTRKADVKRRVEREFKEMNACVISRGATAQDIDDILDAGMELLMESRAKLMKLFKKHDYYYEYSDDGRVYHNGCAERRAITMLMEKLDCDFKFTELFGYINNHITEDMVPYKGGHACAGDPEEWARKGWNIAPVPDFHMLPRVRYNEIARFFGDEESK
jgi:hypothetical protein